MPMRRSAIHVSSIALLSLLSACAGGGGEPRIAADAWTGPPISLQTAQGNHIAVLTAPTGGWSFVLDRTRPAFGRSEAFVTATQPDPAAMHTQAQARHEAGTGVPVTTALELYARELDHGEKPADQPYRLVATVPALPGAPPRVPGTPPAAR
jgi:hypothetical protein